MLRVATLSNSHIDINNSNLEEFKSLLMTAGYQPSLDFSQRIEHIDKAIYCGIGKLIEISNTIKSINESLKDESIDYLAVDFELTGTQKKNIETIVSIPVIDRTNVILEIFERNAKTKEAKLQVEIAKLKYSKAQLVDDKASYSQVTSGSGHNKGEGEKAIELSRRSIDRIIYIKSQELEKAKTQRRAMRASRQKNKIPSVAIVGYTNAGKSTLVNHLLAYSSHKDKLVLSENKLFATLETSTREIDAFDFPKFLVTDTVGFVSRLPLYLIDAFKATLEEITEADLIVHVVDYSSTTHEEQIKTTNKILEDIGVNNIPTIYLYNKYDLLTTPPSILPNDSFIWTSLKDKEDDKIILEFIAHSLAKNWEKVETDIPLDTIYYQFKKDNYVIKENIKGDIVNVIAYINPTTKYKYSYLFKDNL